MRAIDADKLAGKATYMYGFGENKYVPEKAIKAAPTITYEDLVPHGRWERKELQIAPFGVTQTLVCTNCGYDHEYDEWFDRCPNCGAKMDG